MVELREKEQLSGEEFINLGNFVNTIVAHITDGNDIEKEVTGIMGGTPYETASERIKREVYEQFKDQFEENKKALDERDRRIAELEAELAKRDGSPATGKN